MVEPNPQIEINSVINSLMFISAGFLPWVRSQRLNWSFLRPQSRYNDDRIETNSRSPSGGAVTTVLKNFRANCVDTSRPSNRCQSTVFWASRSCEPAGWLALLLIKAGDVETNPGPTTTHKQVWICDICRKQIHCRNQRYR